MKSIKGAYIDLVATAKQVEKALTRVAKASEMAARLRRSALWGAMGFVLGAGTTFAALAAFSVLTYAFFAVPTAALFGLLVGVILSRDHIDRDNDRSETLIGKAWELRQQEVLQLENAIKAAKRNPTPRLALLEETLARLQIASPHQLIAHYELRDHRATAPHPSLAIGAPDSQRVLDARPAPPQQLPGHRQDDD